MPNGAVVHHFTTEKYAVEFFASGNTVTVRVTDRTTGQTVAVETLARQLIDRILAEGREAERLVRDARQYDRGPDLSW